VTKLGAGGPLAIKAVRREEDSKPPRVVVDVAGAVRRGGAVAEGQRHSGRCQYDQDRWRSGRPAAFAFELDGLPPGESGRGALLTLTATTPGDAIEVAIRLD